MHYIEETQKIEKNQNKRLTNIKIEFIVKASRGQQLDKAYTQLHKIDKSLSYMLINSGRTQQKRYLTKINNNDIV